MKDKEKVGDSEEAAEETTEEVAEQPEAKVPGPGAWEIPIPEGAEFGGLPPGTYISKCTEEPKEVLSSKQEPQTEFVFVVVDPDYPEYEGREGHYWCSRKPKAWWNITQTLDAMGVPYEIVKGPDNKAKTFRFDPMDCVGAMCKTVWEEQTYLGRTRSRVRRIVSIKEEIEDLGGEAEEQPF